MVSLGTLKKEPGVMRLKLRVSNNMMSSGNAIADTTPNDDDRPKNKLKIVFQKDDFFETKEKDVDDVLGDESPFQIFVPQNVTFSESTRGRKKSIFDDHNKSVDPEDDEWVPGGSNNSLRNRRKTVSGSTETTSSSSKVIKSKAIRTEKKVKQVRKVPAAAAKKVVSRLSKVKPKSDVRSRLKKKLSR